MQNPVLDLAHWNFDTSHHVDPYYVMQMNIFTLPLLPLYSNALSDANTYRN